MKQETSQLLEEARSRAEHYLETIDERRVFPDAEALQLMAHFDEALPGRGSEPLETLDLLDRYGSPSTVGNAGSRYFGFVVGGSYPVTVAANWLATAWDQVASAPVTSPIADRLETVASSWLLEILDLPRESSVSFVTGATMSTFTALAAARHKLLARQGWDVESKGLFGAPEINVVVSEESHVTVFKALSMLGFGKDRVVRVPTDANGAVDLSRFPEIDGNTLVCLQAGNVNSGAFDPIGEICDRARAAGAWVHVDGAFGLWARASRKRAHLAEGAEKADSWAVDGHKWLNTPYDCGLVICRDQEAIFNAMSVTAAYLRNDSQSAQNLMPEFSKRARGVEIWAALRTLGREGVAELIDGCSDLAMYFAQGLRDLGLTVHNEVVINQVVTSWDSPARTEKLLKAVQEDGTCWFGPTVWKGQPGFRVSVASWKTTKADIDRSLQAIAAAMESVAAQEKGV